MESEDEKLQQGRDEEKGAEAYHERVAGGVGCHRPRRMDEESNPTPEEVGHVGATGSKLSRHSDADSPRMLHLAFLHRIGRALSPMCELCKGHENTPLHALFVYERWARKS